VSIIRSSLNTTGCWPTPWLWSRFFEALAEDAKEAAALTRVGEPGAELVREHQLEHHATAEVEHGLRVVQIQ